MSERTPRNVWPMARVVECNHGREGHVRSVQIKTRVH